MPGGAAAEAMAQMLCGSSRGIAGALDKRVLSMQQQQVSVLRKRGYVKAHGGTSGTQEGYKVLVKSEIPEHIERASLLRQLHQFAASEFQDGGLATYGMPMDVRVIDEYEEGNESSAVSVGFSVTIRNPAADGSGASEAAYFRVTMDDEPYEIYETLMRDPETGMPKKANYDGSEPITAVGKHLLVQRKEGELDRATAEVLSMCLRDLRTAIERYMAFDNVCIAALASSSYPTTATGSCMFFAILLTSSKSKSEK